MLQARQEAGPAKILLFSWDTHRILQSTGSGVFQWRLTLFYFFLLTFVTERQPIYFFQMQNRNKSNSFLIFLLSARSALVSKEKPVSSLPVLCWLTTWKKHCRDPRIIALINNVLRILVSPRVLFYYSKLVWKPQE